jgi:hypothetical protein
MNRVLTACVVLPKLTLFVVKPMVPSAPMRTICEILHNTKDRGGKVLYLHLPLLPSSNKALTWDQISFSQPLCSNRLSYPTHHNMPILTKCMHLKNYMWISLLSVIFFLKRVQTTSTFNCKPFFMFSGNWPFVSNICIPKSDLSC